MDLRVVIVGAGRSGLRLAQQISRRHQVLLVDNNPGSLISQATRLDLGEEPVQLPPEAGLQAMAADGTSRIVLSKLYDEQLSCAVVAMTGSDDYNLEVGRLAKGIGFDPVIAILHHSECAENYRAEGITPIDRAQLLAGQIEQSLRHHGAVLPTGIGLGRGELIEIRLLRTSPMLNMPLKNLAPQSWRVAAVFREDELIVPTGETVLQVNDRVLLVGSPDVLPAVAEYLHQGLPQFPMPFGPNVVTLERGGEDADLLAGQLRMPSSVLLIAYGLAVGPHGLGWLGDLDTVGFLYEVGFIMLMFLAGMEIDFNNIRQRGRKALVVVLLMCGGTFALAFLAASWAGFAPIYGLAFGATSVGLPLAVLKETHNLRTPVGQSVMLVGSVGEFLTVIGMTVYYFGARHGLSLALVVGLGKLLGMLALSALVLRTMVALAWWRPARFSRLVDEDDASEIGVRTAMVLMMVFSLLAVASGLEPIVGSFVAGALISFVLRGKDVLEEKLSVVGHGLFIPIFFAVVGMRFDPMVVTLPNLALAGKFMAIMLGIRLLPGVGLLWLGSTPRQSLAVSSILSAPLTLVVAIAALGLELGAVDQAGEGTLVLLAALSGVVFPLLFRLLDRSGTPPAEEPEAQDASSGSPGCPSYSNRIQG